MRFLLAVSKRGAAVASPVSGKAVMSRSGAAPALKAIVSKTSSRHHKKKNKAEVENDDDDILKKRKAWGQQCSPECGCVLRLECHVDNGGNNSSSNQGRIVYAQYHAKQLVTVYRDGELRPQLTSQGRPLFKECECGTLHTLAEEITNYLPDKPFYQIQNATEVTGVRSSLALQHAILVDHGRNPKRDGHCFDLVEEALVAMLKSQMPRPRIARMPSSLSSSSSSLSMQSQQRQLKMIAAPNYTEAIKAHYRQRAVEAEQERLRQQQQRQRAMTSSSSSFLSMEGLLDHNSGLEDNSSSYSSDEDETVTRYGRALRRVQRARASMAAKKQQMMGKDRSSGSLTSPRTMSALTMFDLAYDHSDEWTVQEYEDYWKEERARREKLERRRERRRRLQEEGMGDGVGGSYMAPSQDWEQYVDELMLYREQEPEAE